MSDVYFLSGWAGVAELFPELSRRVHFAVPFLEGDEALLVDAAAASGARILAGWSTGAHMIVKYAKRLLPLFSTVVLVAPFLRFTDSFPARLVKSMIARMEKDPAGTGRDFWKACGFAGPAGWRREWAPPLTDGLRYLLASDAQDGSVPAGNVTVLHGTADRIVRPGAVTAVMASLPGAGLVRYAGGHCPDEAILEPYLFEGPPVSRKGFCPSLDPPHRDRTSG